MLFVKLKDLVKKYLAEIIISALVMLSILAFLIINVDVAHKSDVKIFSYSVMVRNTVEEMDKVFERAEVNLNVLSDSIANSYNSSRRHDKTYNMHFVSDLDSFIKSVLMNSPGVDGSWFQLNADLPYSAQAYSWYELRDSQFIDKKAEYDADFHNEERKITPQDDPYYFEAINSSGALWTEVYADADTKQKMVSVVSPVYKDGVLVGVVGLDVSLAKLEQILGFIRLELPKSEVYLVDNHKCILASEDDDGKPVNNPEKKIKKALQMPNDGTIEYMEGLEGRCAIVLTISNGYKVIITAPNKVLFEGSNDLIRVLFLMYVLFAAATVFALINHFRIINLSGLADIFRAGIDLDSSKKDKNH